MLIIKKLSKQIKDELCDAEKYAKDALEYKDEMPMLAEMYYSLSLDELKHMAQLHNQVVKVISEVKAKGKELPLGMQEIYDYLHEEQIEHEAGIRMLQSMFRS